MRLLLFFLTAVNAYWTIAQSDPSILSSDPEFPITLDKIPTLYCGSSIGDEQKADSLLSELLKLEDSLSKLEIKTTSIESNGYVFLFILESTETIMVSEFPSSDYGLRFYQRCITDSILGKKDQWNLFSKNSLSDITVYKYGPTFLTISKTTHYSENCEYWITTKYYMIKEDEFENFIKK